MDVGGGASESLRRIKATLESLERHANLASRSLLALTAIVDALATRVRDLEDDVREAQGEPSG